MAASVEQDLARERELAELRAANRKLARRLAKREEDRAAMVEAVYQGAREAGAIVGRADPVPRPARDRRRSPEEALLWLGDWQMGKRTGSYSTEVCVARVHQAVTRAIKVTAIQREDHPVRRCHVVFGGDLIENLTVFPGNQWEVDASIYEQMFTASRLIEEVVLALLGPDEDKRGFEQVLAYEVWGNHGRIGRRGDVPREDNLDRMICRIARERLENQPRLSWHTPAGDPPDWHQIATIGNYRALLFHGDQIRTFGNTPVHAITKRVTDWASGVYEPFDDAYCGHWHRKMTIPLANGGSIYITPSTESGSAFARDHLGSDSLPRQRLMFIHPDHGRVTGEYMLYLD